MIDDVDLCFIKSLIDCMRRPTNSLGLRGLASLQRVAIPSFRGSFILSSSPFFFFPFSFSSLCSSEMGRYQTEEKSNPRLFLRPPNKTSPNCKVAQIHNHKNTSPPVPLTFKHISLIQVLHINIVIVYSRSWGWGNCIKVYPGVKLKKYAYTLIYFNTPKKSLIFNNQQYKFTTTYGEFAKIISITQFDPVSLIDAP